MSNALFVGHRGRVVAPRNNSQRRLIRSAYTNDVVFALGPAGTGKTFIPIALAAKAISDGETKRLVLVRPAVTCGEDLGYLPGELQDKIDPFMQPFYEALTYVYGQAGLKKRIEDSDIETIPLGFLRGRTINDAYVILDEAQNATREQLKMFLTRLGKRSQAFISGDPSQTDLRPVHQSCLRIAEDILGDVPGIGFVRMSDEDIVRHGLVRDVLHAFDRYEIHESWDRDIRRERAHSTACSPQTAHE